MKPHKDGLANDPVKFFLSAPQVLSVPACPAQITPVANTIGSSRRQSSRALFLYWLIVPNQARALGTALHPCPFLLLGYSYAPLQGTLPIGVKTLPVRAVIGCKQKPIS